MYIRTYIYTRMYIYIILNSQLAAKFTALNGYGVATISRLLQVTGLFCKRALIQEMIFCKRD